MRLAYATFLTCCIVGSALLPCSPSLGSIGSGVAGSQGQIEQLRQAGKKPRCPSHRPAGGGADGAAVWPEPRHTGGRP